MTAGLTGGIPTRSVDVLLVGAGIMSATLGVLLRQLQPDWDIEVVEKLNRPAAEASNVWHNAGTGHSAYCELNYTPQRPDGSVEIDKAIHIAAQFQQTQEFWSYLVTAGIIPDPGLFVHSVPHMSFVEGEADVAYLHARYAALRTHPLFAGMRLSAGIDELADWMPLMFPRPTEKPVAATRMDSGMDVDFGALTGLLFRYLMESGTQVRFDRQVEDLQRDEDGWAVRVRDHLTGGTEVVQARFVFLGAGGAALPLLQKSGVSASRGLAGFPFSGQFLRCTNPELVARHHAKVYGKPALGAPPMSMPHLDTRVVDGRRELLFGPYAGFTTKFLKSGSWRDFPASIRPANIPSLVGAGVHNLNLVSMLARQVVQSEKARVKELQTFVPDASSGDWELITAGVRVQVVERDPREGGVLQFGTKLVTDDTGTLAALLGASPGASTAVPIMLSLLGHCFPQEFEGWTPQLESMVSPLGAVLSRDADQVLAFREESVRILRLSPDLGQEDASRADHE